MPFYNDYKMIDNIKNYLDEVQNFVETEKSKIEEFRIRFNGKKGILNDLFAKFKEVPNEQKKEFGQKINTLKQAVSDKLEALKSATEISEVLIKEDLTKPAYPLSLGARDMQDTFFIEQNPDILLRTHTSSVQIRHMENNEPPLRILSPGRVFRNEAISSRSHCIFHQIEGLYIDENVSFADLKQTIQFFTTELFGKSKIRMRPSYFPFTEPSAEVDVYWGLNSETDYRITKGTGWLEIMGCGMVDPAVLKNVNIDSDKYSGYAFGMGIERIVMLLYQMSDIRLFFENDVRMLQQFKSL